ncbi:shikimate dehydrogenase [Enhydrobacter aerosaccus]|uniref:Shikimate dehydrogenase n=1 Tax=Enhydrobacter aerosaccus TaxID=225324 RepID=A0A1T4PFP6_9HYPH|nr:shikimate dehydrogenase [Enhydrobacter aerosaccus]SJZ90046.1 shikimate dehydrogenase [Enhydrobacter aerosaccus]
MDSTIPPLFTGLFAINGETRLYGTIGSPIRQLRMTGIMPQVFAAVGANAVWLPFEGDAALLPVMLEALARMRNLGGFTVTIPNKTAIIHLLGRTTRRAQAAGSVNLVKRDPNGVLAGDMADGAGFVRGLEAHGHRIRGTSVWLVGLGGVGGAIAAALCEAGVGRLLVTEINEARADTALDRLSRFYPDVPVAMISAENPPKGIHYAINATPLGLRPDDPLPFDPMTLDPDAVVAEVIMSPIETQLLQRARTHGRRVHYGRHTLDHQIPVYLEWFDIDTKGIDIVRLVRSIP